MRTKGKDGKFRSVPLADRIQEKFVIQDDGCWVWTAARTDRGYGTLYDDGRNYFAYRRMYEVLIGPVPEGMQIDHLCRNRACVNPSHLEPVTCRENLLRGQTHAARNARKTHCPRQHEYTLENTHIKPDGARRCRKCAVIENRKHRIRKRARQQRAIDLTQTDVAA